MKLFALVLPALGVTLTAGVMPAEAIVINFDSLADNTVVTNQFPEATFSTNPGFQARTIPFAGLFGSSVPNILGVTDLNGDLVGTEDLLVNFSQPVNNLTFQIVGDNSTNPGLVDIFTNGSFATQFTLTADGDGFTPDLIDLSSFANITSIFINSITDGGGIGYDDFSFDPVPTQQTVPEPSTIFGLVLAMGCSALLRKKGTAK